MTQDKYEKLQEQVRQGNHLAEMEAEQTQPFFVGGMRTTPGELKVELLSAAEQKALSGVITEVVRPMIQALGAMLEKNVEAMERLAAQQAAQNNRLDAMEKQLRLQTPITPKQGQYLNDSIRARARELLDEAGLADDKWAVMKLGNAIRKSVLIRNGAAALREIPRCEYQVAMHHIGIWNDMLTIRDVVKEARERAEGQSA